MEVIGCEVRYEEDESRQSVSSPAGRAPSRTVLIPRLLHVLLLHVG